MSFSSRLPHVSGPQSGENEGVTFDDSASSGLTVAPPPFVFAA